MGTQPAESRLATVAITIPTKLPTVAFSRCVVAEVLLQIASHCFKSECKIRADDRFRRVHFSERWSCLCPLMNPFVGSFQGRISVNFLRQILSGGCFGMGWYWGRLAH